MTALLRAFRQWALPFMFGLVGATAIGAVNFYFDSNARADRVDAALVSHDDQLSKLADAAQRSAVAEERMSAVLERLERQHDRDTQDLRRVIERRRR